VQPHSSPSHQFAAVRYQQRSTSALHIIDNALTNLMQVVSSEHEPMQPPEASSHSNQPVQPSHPIPQILSVTEDADASQLQFYEPTIHDIIEQAKQFSHCDTASVSAFPQQAKFSNVTVEYVKEAIWERRSKSLFVPNGNYFSSHRIQ